MLAQTGWIRPHPQTVCQYWAVLNRVKVFVYEITDEFMGYTAARGFLDLRKCECGFEAAKRIYAPDSTSQEPHVKAARARLHDLWELFATAPKLMKQPLP